MVTLPGENNGSVDVTFERAITHQKHLGQSGRSLGAVRGVQWTFSMHSAYLLKSQSENKKFSWSVWMSALNTPFQNVQNGQLHLKSIHLLWKIYCKGLWAE